MTTAFELPMPVAGFQPKSTNISSVNYDDERRVLTVSFQDGGSYEYDNVPRELYEQFSRASSAGRFFGQAVRGLFRHRRVE